MLLGATSTIPHPKSALQSLLWRSTTPRPHPAVTSGSGSPLPSLGAIRAPRVPRGFSESRQRGWG